MNATSSPPQPSAYRDPAPIYTPPNGAERLKRTTANSLDSADSVNSKEMVTPAFVKTQLTCAENTKLMGIAVKSTGEYYALRAAETVRNKLSLIAE